MRAAWSAAVPADVTTNAVNRRAQQRWHRHRAAAVAAGGDGPPAAAHAAAAAAAAGRDARREVAVLGGEDYILSQRSGVEEELFKGAVLGVDADVAGVGFRQSLLRSLRDLPEGLEAPARFLDRVALHVAKNGLAGRGSLPGQTPLILSIWGPKGCGKTFTLELCLRTLGLMPVCLSAGELEDEWAGEPGRRLRERYAFAALHAESTGEPTCLVISDLDAGCGRFEGTMNTVNSQNLQGTLMALCDDPLAVSTGQDWGALRPRCRVPIFATCNDLTLLYAPLVREGRMDKFFYEPDRGEMAQMIGALFAPQLDAAAVGALLDAFPAQPLDFFAAIRSRLVDSSVRSWLQESASSDEDLTAALLSSSGGRPVPEPHVSLEAALAAGAALADEQQAVLDIRLSREYMKGLEDDILHAEERRERWKRQAELDAARRLAAAQAAEAVRARAAEETRARAAEARAAEAEARAAAGLPPVDLAAAEEEEEEVAAEPPAPATASGLPGMSPDELAAALRERRAVALDVRSAREWDWGRIKGAKHAPYVVTKGSSLTPETAANPGFLDAAHAALGAPAAGGDLCICLYGPGQDLDTEGSEALVSKEKFVSIAPNGTGSVDGEDIVAAAARALQRAGYAQLRELAGGYRAWDLSYRPDGRRRAKGAFRDKSSGELEFWTASN